MVNREIKFRAWDNIERKMLDTVESWNKVWWDDTSPESEYDYHSRCLYIDNQGHVLEHTDEHGMCDMHYLLQGKPKYELMQYTGLKDKNGKEIYEGDIVKAIFNPSNIREVLWRNDQSQWSIGGFGQWEIIGNIYETPSLLANSHEGRGNDGH